MSVHGQGEHIIHDRNDGMSIGNPVADAIRVSRDDSEHVAE